jgi:hypothetical protein
MAKLRSTLSFLSFAGILFFATPDARAAQVTVSCTPNEVFVWSGHVHVRCNPPFQNNIQFFAIQILAGNANAPEVDRFLSITSDALVHGRQLTMLFETTDVSANAWGCAASNCRRPRAYGLR